MARDAVSGLIAGAVGTVALNIATYADMAIRGRAPSEVPARLVGTLTEKVGLDLASAGGGAETRQHRQSGVGALLGYLVGLGIGTAYGALRPAMAAVPTPAAGLGLGLAAMAASDVPIVALRVSDPRTWGLAGWLSDVIPHLIYGLVTAYVFAAISGDRARRRWAWARR
ncbi:MAG: hypothetical protein QJR03_08825 [Sphaerobacter sp.]|nr:hypothetical protein [Sphaerobacter sp.]